MKVKKLLAFVACLVVVGVLGSMIFPLFRVSAAGLPDLAVSPSDAAVSAYPNPVTVSFTPATVMANNSQIIVSYASAYGDTSLVTGDITVTKTGDANFTSAAITLGTDSFTATLTTAGNLDITNDFQISISNASSHFQMPVTAGNYSWSVITKTSSTGDTLDYGAILQYVGDDNDVFVTASVNPVLAFAIRNDTNTGDTNICPLGTLSLTGVNTCSYYLKVATNAEDGYTVNVASDGDLRKSGSGDVTDDLDLDPIADDSTVAFGTEGYGIALVAGLASGGTVTETNGAGLNWATDDTPMPIASESMYSSDGTNNPDAQGTPTNYMAFVTHRAAMDADTAAGTYYQTVTYVASPNF